MALAADTVGVVDLHRRLNGGRTLDLRPVAVVLLAVWAVNAPIIGGVTSGTVAGLVAAPLWLPALRRYRMARATMLLGCAAVVAGILLAVYQSSFRDYDLGNARAQVSLLVAALSGIGLILWARNVIPLRWVAVVLGAGLLVSGLPYALASGNPWKFGVGVPATIILLGLGIGARWFVQVALLGGVALLSVANDYRSMAGIAALAAGFVILQAVKFRPPKGWLGPLMIGVLGAVAVAGLYVVGTNLAANGTLGAEIATRTEQQLQQAGTLIAAARPEWIGTIGLMGAHPMGFGFGAVPEYADVWSAKQGLYTVGIGSTNGYVDNYMFGGQIRLHSTIADLWSQAGLAGVAFALTLAVVLVAALAGQLRAATLTGLAAFLVANALWDIGFSPLYGSAMRLAAAVGLVLLLRETSVSGGRDDRIRSSGGRREEPQPPRALLTA